MATPRFGHTTLLQTLFSARTRIIIIATRTCALILLRLQVNIPKTRRTYCKGKDCKKHTQHKVTQYKAGKVRRKP